MPEKQLSDFLTSALHADVSHDGFALTYNHVSGKLELSSTGSATFAGNALALLADASIVEHALASQNIGNNVLSIRHLDGSSPAAIRFLDAAAGHEKGAVGYNNPSGHPSNDVFIEISGIPFDYATAPEFNLLQTTDWNGVGSHSYQQWLKMALKKDGSIRFYPNGTGDEDPEIGNGVTICPTPASSNKMMVCYGSAVFSGGLVDPGDGTTTGVRVGYEVGADFGFIESGHTGVTNKPLKINVGGGAIHLNGPITLNNHVTMIDTGNFTFATTTGTKIGTDPQQKMAFWNAMPVIQQVLATGAGKTVDNVITFLQTIGLCRQS